MLRRTESTQRHDMVLNAVIQLADKEAHYITQKQIRELDEDETHTRIPDAKLVPCPHNIPIYIDVSVTHPCADKYFIAASCKTLSAADRRSAIKHKQYDRIAEREGGRFLA